MSETTTVQVRIETWRALMALKERPGESIDDVVSRLIERQAEARDSRTKAAS